jgi:hypothetical protein
MMSDLRMPFGQKTIVCCDIKAELTSKNSNEKAKSALWVESQSNDIFLFVQEVAILLAGFEAYSVQDPS